MDKKEFQELVKQYSNDTAFLSYIKENHPAYIKLISLGAEAIPWALEILKEGLNDDFSNNHWLLFSILGKVSNDECKIPKECAGKLSEIRNLYLKWGEEKGLI